jgi:carbon monoxide dehydrogenase subunit G
MSKRNVQLTVAINNTPEAVIGFVSDIRNRSKYLQSLKSISDIEGEPGEVGTTWKWSWDFLDHEFEGTGQCQEFEAGRRYSFATEGGITSQFTYQAEPAGEGTNLTIDVEFEVPEALAKMDGLADLLAGAKQRGQASVQALKEMLE